MDCACIVGYKIRLCQSEMNPTLVHTPAYFKSIGLMQIRALTHSFYDFECSVGVNQMPFFPEARLCSENYQAQSCKQVGFWQLAYTVNEWVAYWYSSNCHRGALEQGQSTPWWNGHGSITSAVALSDLDLAPFCIDLHVIGRHLHLVWPTEWPTHLLSKWLWTL